MKRTGVFVTKEELALVVTAYKCSGMCTSGGESFGKSPEERVFSLIEKYNPPTGSVLDATTGEFVIPGQDGDYENVLG